jgi:hypothetical protein
MIAYSIPYLNIIANIHTLGRSLNSKFLGLRGNVGVSRITVLKCI